MHRKSAMNEVPSDESGTGHLRLELKYRVNDGM
jgi:hypothetical protein